jgi:hypothetical protein
MEREFEKNSTRKGRYFIANDQTSWDGEHWVLRHQIWRCPMFRQSHTFETTTNEGIAIHYIYII